MVNSVYFLTKKMNMKHLKFLITLWFLFLSIGTFTSCEGLFEDDEDNLCDQIECLNGGVCINGDCLCPDDYYGTYCQNQEEPDPPCIVNDWAYIKFENQSTTGKTYDVVWDGSRIVTLSPGQSSDRFTVSAGSHTLVFKISNTGDNACNPSTPNLAQCSYVKHWCTT